MCKGSKGLLTKIVEVMKKEPTTSTFRFWLARAVESYLRGNTSYCDQVFLMRRGLLQVSCLLLCREILFNMYTVFTYEFFFLLNLFLSVQHVASNIVEHEIRHKEILQSSFDLLGELIKFNVEAFKTFEEILHTQPNVSSLALNVLVYISLQTCIWYFKKDYTEMWYINQCMNISLNLIKELRILLLYIIDRIRF